MNEHDTITPEQRMAYLAEEEPEPELDRPLRMDQDRQDVEEYRERERG